MKQKNIKIVFQAAGLSCGLEFYLFKAMKFPGLLDICTIGSAVLAAVVLIHRYAVDDTRVKYPASGNSSNYHEFSSRGVSQQLGGKSRVVRKNRDFQKDAEDILSLAQGAERNKRIRLLMKEWAEVDVWSAMKWANQLKGSKERNMALVEAMTASDDPLAIASISEREGISLSQLSRNAENDVISPFVIILSRSLGATGAFEWVNANMTGIEKCAQLANIIGDASIVDKELAVKLIKSLPEGKSRELAVMQYVTNTVADDPKGAIDMLTLASESSSRQAAMSQLVTKWMEHDSDQFKEYLKNYPAGKFRNELLLAAAKQFSYTKPTEALQLAANMEGETKDRVTSDIYKNWSITDPVAAYQNLQTQKNPELEKKIIPLIVSSSVLNGDHEKGAQVVKAITDSSEKSKMTAQLMQSWVVTNVSGSASWLTTLRPGPAYDAGVEVLINRLAYSDPDAAVMWIKTIEDPQLSEKMKTLLNSSK